MGRNTQGVRLIKLAKSENLVGIERIVEVKDETEVDVSDAASEASQETEPE
jgi:hypothetical protein